MVTLMTFDIKVITTTTFGSRTTVESKSICSFNRRITPNTIQKLPGSNNTANLKLYDAAEISLLLLLLLCLVVLRPSIDLEFSLHYTCTLASYRDGSYYNH